MGFAKPWERGAGEDVAEAIADRTHQPWQPKGAKVPKSVKKAHSTKIQIQTNANTTSQRKPEWAFKRQEFAKAYLIDCNATMAALRCGLAENEDEARKEGWRFLKEPETLAIVQAFAARLETDKIVSRERVILGLYEEANYHGLGSSHSARIAAWSKLAQMLDVERPKQPDDPMEKKARGGVMLLPAPTSIDAWEQQASASQAALKATVRQ